MNFTVKWVVIDSDGIERHRIFDVDQFSYSCDSRVPSDEPQSQAMLGVYPVSPRGIVVIGNPHDAGDSMAFTQGKIYVMNERGATVSTYDMGYPSNDGKVFSYGTVSATTPGT